MTLEGLLFPDDLLYLVEHDVWVRGGDPAGGEVTVGITALGTRLSGDIYMCRPKPVGTAVQRGRALAVVELAKAIASVKSPVTGQVVAVNGLLADNPALVHRDPYGEGWIARLRWSDPATDLPFLLSASQAAPALARHARLLDGGS